MKKIKMLLAAVVVFGVLIFVGVKFYNFTVPRTEKACISRSGEWVGSYEECLLPTSDGGLACTDSSQCQGYCEPDYAVLSKDEIQQISMGIKSVKGICSKYKQSKTGSGCEIKKGQLGCKFINS